MVKTLAILNDLVHEDVMSRYVIGSAMGATFYVELFLTFDRDIFILLPQSQGGRLSLEPLYQSLRTRGYTKEGTCVSIEGIPVQFLAVYSQL